MTNNNYRNGANRERRLKKKFEADGWFVIRSSGSHGIVDLALFAPPIREQTFAGHYLPQIRFIQSKATGYLTREEKIKKKELENKLGIEIEVM